MTCYWRHRFDDHIGGLARVAHATTGILTLGDLRTVIDQWCDAVGDEPPKRRPSGGNSFVYFARGPAGTVKIGCSVQPVQRIIDLNLGSGQPMVEYGCGSRGPVSLVAIVKDGHYQHEKMLHKLHASEHLNSVEYFRGPRIEVFLKLVLAWSVPANVVYPEWPSKGARYEAAQERLRAESNAQHEQWARAADERLAREFSKKYQARLARKAAQETQVTPSQEGDEVR